MANKQSTFPISFVESYQYAAPLYGAIAAGALEKTFFGETPPGSNKLRECARRTLRLGQQVSLKCVAIAPFHFAVWLSLSKVYTAASKQADQ